MITSTHLRSQTMLLAAVLLIPAMLPARPEPRPQAQTPVPPGCTVLYTYDGQAALAGNNEDFINPFTLMWFIPASPGRFGRVYFGYDDTLPQGGLNDQGVFFDALALAYKEMPVTSQRPHFPEGDLALVDEIMSRSANVQDVIDITGQWNRVAGEYAQYFYGDRFGDSVIIDGDNTLLKQGAFQLATNFRLVDNPNPPYPEERYTKLLDMLSNADSYDVALVRDALDAAHAEGDAPTLYSQVYELNSGTIHLYLYHDFQYEVVLNLADELAKGPHVVRISSLFPENPALQAWTSQQEAMWIAGYEEMIDDTIQPERLGWMSGEYALEGNAGSGPLKVYLDNDQLYLQRPNELPIELYPMEPGVVFHHFFNGMDLTFTFQRNLWGQVSGAQGTFSFKPYNIALPYNLVRSGVVPFNTSLLISAGGAAVLLLVMAVLAVRRRKAAVKADPAA